MADKMQVLTSDEVCGIFSAIENVRKGIKALSESITPSQRYLTDSELSLGTSVASLTNNLDNIPGTEIFI